MSKGYEAVGSGYFGQDSLNYPLLYMYDYGNMNENVVKGALK